MLIQVSGQREDAIHALINTWLKIPDRWCLTCNKTLDIRDWPCCDKPFLTTNQIVFKRFIEEMKDVRDAQKNKFASSETKSMRYLLRFPPGLYEFLDMSMKRLYGEKLFTDEYNNIWFAKKFQKYFSVPEEI